MAETPTETPSTPVTLDINTLIQSIAILTLFLVIISIIREVRG